MFLKTTEHMNRLADLGKHSGSYFAMIDMLASEL